MMDVSKSYDLFETLEGEVMNSLVQLLPKLSPESLKRLRIFVDLLAAEKEKAAPVQ